MSDGHRRFIGPSGRQLIKVALLILAIVALRLAGDEPKQEQQSPRHESTGAAQLSPDRSVGGAADAPQAHEKQGDPSAVIGPGTLPDWAIVAFTFFLALLGYLQYRLDVRTARETKDALEVARLSAAATELLARSQIATLRAQMHPYEYRMTKVHAPGADTAQGFLLSVGWINKGSTAARECILRGSAQIMSADEPVPPFEIVDEYLPATPSIGANVTVRSGEAFVPVEYVRHCLETGDKLLLWSRCDYRDVFSDEPRLTETCVEMSITGTVDDVCDGAACDGRYRSHWRPVGPQNIAT